MYNFGSPRVGNQVFHSLYKQFVMDSFRVQVDGDVIPGTPFSDGVNKYEHHGSEVLIDGLEASGSIIINPTSIELRLRARPKTSVVGHSTVTYLKGLAAIVDSVRQYSDEAKGGNNGGDVSDDDDAAEATTDAVLAKYDSVRPEKSGSLFKFSSKQSSKPSARSPAAVEEPVPQPVEIEIDHPDVDFGVKSLDIDK